MARISRSKSADEDVSDGDRSQASKAYSSIGISLYNDEGEYQDLNTTLDQLAAKWDTLTDAERNYIAEQSAGIRNINTFNALMENYGEAKELAASAMSDTDFIDETQQKHMDSMQAKLNTLKASLQDFWNSLLDTGIINTGIEAITLLTKGLEGLINLFKGIGDILPGVSGGFTALAGTVTTLVLSFQTFSNIKKTGSFLGGIKETGNDIMSLIDTFRIYKEYFKDGFNKTLAKELFETDSGIIKTFFNSIAGGAKTAIKEMTPIGKTMLGIGVAATAIYIGVKAFDALTNSSKETAEAVKKLNDEYKQSQDTAKNANSTINEFGSEFEILSKGVSPLGENISLTTSEFERYHEICNKLADIFPNLITGYDSQGNAILDLTGNVKELNDEYDQLLLKQARENYKEIGTYEENFRNLTGDRSWGTEVWDTLTDWGYADIGGRTTAQEVYDELKKIQGMDYEELKKYLAKLENERSDELSWMMNPENLGIDPNMTEEEFKNLSDKITSAMNTVQAQINDGSDSLKTAMQSYLQILTLDKDNKNYSKYSKIDDSIINQVSLLISKTTSDQLKQLEEDGVTYEQYVENILNTLSDNKEASASLNRLLSIDENTDVDEMKKIIEEDLDVLAKALEYDDKAQLKVKLGLEDKEKFVKEASEVVSKVKNNVKQENEKTINDLAENANQSNVFLAQDLTRRQNEISKDNKNSTEVKTYTSKDGSKSIVVTPVLPDGKVLNSDELNNYVNGILEEGKIDDKNLVLATFDKKDVKNGKDINKQANDFAKKTNKALKSNKELKNIEKDINKFIKDKNISTADELELLGKCVDETNSWAEAMELYNQKSINLNKNASDLEKLENNLTTVKTNIDNINDAIDASQSSTGLAKEQIDNIVKAFESLPDSAKYDYDKLFESTAEGVHLNVQELERLNGELEKSEAKKYADEIKDLTDQYSDLCVAIDKAGSSTERSELVNQKTQLEKQIKQAQELQSRYEGLTNAVTKWKNATAGGEEGDTYDSIVEGLDSIKEKYDKGLIGTREFKSGVQMMTNKDMSGASIKEYLDVYNKNFAKFKSYFQEDGSGLEKFLKDLNKINKEWANQNKDGSWNINASIEDMANQMDMSQASIEEIFKKLNDYGFDIDFREETDYLKGVREEAEKVSDSLKKAFGDEYNVDLTVKGEDAIHEQIKSLEELQKKCDEGSEEYKNLSKQIEYLRAKAGETKEALNFEINYKDNKDELDKITNKLKTIDKYKKLSFDWDTKSVTNVENQIDPVKKKLLELKKEGNGKIDLSAEGATELIDVFNALINKKQDLERPAVVKLNKNDFDGAYQDVITKIQDYQKSVESLEQVKANVEIGVQTKTDQEQAQKEVNNAIAAINNSTGDSKKIFTELDLKPGDLTQEKINGVLGGIDAKKMVDVGFNLTDEAKTTLGGIKASETKNVDVKVNDSEYQSLKNDVAIQKTQNIGVSVFKKAYTDFISQVQTPKTQTIYVKKVETNANGNAHVQGNANANGNARPSLIQRGKAFLQGTWGAIQGGMSLVGELGREIVVRGNQFFTVGDSGAEMFNVQPGDIIFNHVQSEQILKNGYVTANGGRGKIANANGNAFVKGNAFVSGTYTTAGSLPGSNKFYNNYRSKTTAKKASSSTKDKDEFLETMDWIEIKIDRIERAIQNLDTVASSAYKSFSKRNNTLIDEFNKVTEEIQLQQSAYNAYIDAANRVGLSETYASKVRNGTLSIESITNEDLKTKIDEYQELYEKALDARDAVYDLKETLGDIAQAKFDNVVSEFEFALDEIEHRINQVETGLDIVEAKGNFASKEYYDMLLKTEQENINKIAQEYEAVTKAYNEAMSTGAIEQNSEAQQDMLQQIREIEEAWQEAKLSYQEYVNAMREMNWSIFEKQNDYISEITKESEFLIDNLSLVENNLFSKKSGKLNDYGQAVGGLRAVNYNVYMKQADDYRKKIEEVNRELANDPYNTILIDKKNEYIDAQRESIQAANEEKMAVHDLIEESYNRILDILQKLIDKRKEYLEAEKD